MTDDVGEYSRYFQLACLHNHVKVIKHMFDFGYTSIYLSQFVQKRNFLMALAQTGSCMIIETEEGEVSNSFPSTTLIELDAVFGIGKVQAVNKLLLKLTHDTVSQSYLCNFRLLLEHGLAKKEQT